jgi:hypothetical protein
MDRSICEGSPADLTQLVDTLSSAFQHDPALSWILPDPAQRRLRLPKLFDIVVRSDFAAGSVLRSESCEAVTLWRLPGKAHVGFMETLLSGLGYFRTFGTALGRGLAVSHAMESHHPKGIDFRRPANVDDPANQGRLRQTEDEASVYAADRQRVSPSVKDQRAPSPGGLSD